jgi:signal transduction histidine kinase
MPIESRPERARVLLVDDEPEALRTLAALLTRDYEIFTAPNALAAMQELSRIACDAVVSDERMPGMSGTRFLGYVRRTYPDAARVILTAYGDSETLLRAINEGEVERFLLKPVQPSLLRQALSELVTRHRHEVADRVRSSQLVRRNAELEARVRELGEPVVEAVRQLHELAGAPEGAIGAPLFRESLAPVRLDLWVRNFVRAMGGEQPLGERRVHLEVGGEVWCLLDASRFGRLASGLVENAIDATRAGDAITFRVGSSGPSAHFEVANTGCELTAEVRARGLEPVAARRSPPGGPGLQVCRQIAEAHGGTLECESTPDRETRFRVRLPRLER